MLGDRYRARGTGFKPQRGWMASQDNLSLQWCIWVKICMNMISHCLKNTYNISLLFQGLLRQSGDIILTCKIAIWWGFHAHILMPNSKDCRDCPFPCSFHIPLGCCMEMDNPWDSDWVDAHPFVLPLCQYTAWYSRTLIARILILLVSLTFLPAIMTLLITMNLYLFSLLFAGRLDQWDFVYCWSRQVYASHNWWASKFLTSLHSSAQKW